MRITLRLFALLALSAASSVADTQIFWNSPQGAANVTSDGATPMDGGFRFELGVFAADFVPVAPDPAKGVLGNVSQWVENWNPAQRTSYRADIKRYAGSFLATTNAAPFTAGKAAYVWGFRGDPVAGQWILFRAATWTWPTMANGPPTQVTWDAKDATAVIGVVDASSSPAVMKTAAVSNLPPPYTNYSQWVIDELSGETLVAPNEDADHDGNLNGFEFMAGTSPKVKGAPIPMPSSLVDVSGSKYLQLSVPRRSDRPVTLLFQVSNDLGEWFSGSGNTVEVSSTNSLLVVRDLTPMSSSTPKRFIRVRATVP